jgi:hypothetical protein
MAYALLMALAPAPQVVKFKRPLEFVYELDAAKQSPGITEAGKFSAYDVATDDVDKVTEPAPPELNTIAPVSPLTPSAPSTISLLTVLTLKIEFVPFVS